MRHSHYSYYSTIMNIVEEMKIEEKKEDLHRQCQFTINKIIFLN